MYFFQRFFENDVVQSGGDTVTTVVRALAMVAVPGLMVAFFLQNQYWRSSAWGKIEDQYFFVVFSFVAMAGVSIFEWEMLFPDRLDFLVLSPLSLRQGQMLAAKAAALGGFLGLFLLAANVFGMALLPMLGGRPLWRAVCAHGAAVLLAGGFAALAVLALGGTLLCVMPPRLFRTLTPVLQMLGVTALALLLVQYARVGDSMEALLSGRLGAVGWEPPFWFLAVYERLLHGDTAAPFAMAMAWRGVWATVAAGAVAGVTYPLAWARMKAMTMEGGGAAAGRAPSRWRGRLLRRLVKDPVERGTVCFIGQTMGRNSRYPVYLAMYCGTGLAIAISCGTSVRTVGASVRSGLSIYGLHAVMPLLLFWVVAGLRMAFGFPLNLPARWIFRTTGASAEAYMRGARRWVLGCAYGVLGCVIAVLAGMGWSARQLAVQLVCGVCFGALLVEGLMFEDRGMPFSRPRSPGKTSLPLMLTLYLGVLPPLLFGMIWMELRMEKSPVWLPAWVLIVALAHGTATRLRMVSQAKLEDGDEGEPEFQLLGLSGE
jgi:hypothetical protein